MRILVCGSRIYTDAAKVHEVLAGYSGQGATVIHGAARGADTLADIAARHLGFSVERYPAQWDVTPDTPPGRIQMRHDGTKYDIGAGFARNRHMLDSAPDLVIAFGHGRGTSDTVTEARKRGIRVERHA